MNKTILLPLLLLGFVGLGMQSVSAKTVKVKVKKSEILQLGMEGAKAKAKEKYVQEQEAKKSNTLSIQVVLNDGQKIIPVPNATVTCDGLWTGSKAATQYGKLTLTKLGDGTCNCYVSDSVVGTTEKKSITIKGPNASTFLQLTIMDSEEDVEIEVEE